MSCITPLIPMCLVEKVLRKIADEFYVKWLGIDNSHNSWIDKDIIYYKKHFYYNKKTYVLQK